MTSMEIVERTREFVTSTFLYALPDACPTDDEPLFETGIVDSMGVIELVQFLQNAFAIHVGDDEITDQHFRSLRSIADFVTAKRQTAAPS